jgi:hypothetical protein
LLKKPMIFICKLWNGGVGFVCLDSVGFGRFVAIFDVFARFYSLGAPRRFLTTILAL